MQDQHQKSPSSIWDGLYACLRMGTHEQDSKGSSCFTMQTKANIEICVSQMHTYNHYSSSPHHEHQWTSSWAWRIPKPLAWAWGAATEAVGIFPGRRHWRKLASYHRLFFLPPQKSCGHEARPRKYEHTATTAEELFSNNAHLHAHAHVHFTWCACLK